MRVFAEDLARFAVIRAFVAVVEAQLARSCVMRTAFAVAARLKESQLTEFSRRTTPATEVEASDIERFCGKDPVAIRGAVAVMWGPNGVAVIMGKANGKSGGETPPALRT